MTRSKAVDETDPEVARVIELIRRLATKAGAAITAYDPYFDPDDRTLAAARTTARQIAGGIRSQPTSDTG